MHTCLSFSRSRNELELEPGSELHLEHLASRIVRDDDLLKRRTRGILLSNLSKVDVCDAIKSASDTAGFRRGAAVVGLTAAILRVRHIEDIEELGEEYQPLLLVKVEALLNAEIDVENIPVAEVVSRKFDSGYKVRTIVVESVAVHITSDRRIERLAGTQTNRTGDFETVGQEEYRIRHELVCTVKTRRSEFRTAVIGIGVKNTAGITFVVVVRKVSGQRVVGVDQSPAP